MFSPSIQDAADGAVVNVHLFGERPPSLVGLRVVEPQDVRNGGRFGGRIGDFTESAGWLDEVTNGSSVRRVAVVGLGDLLPFGREVVAGLLDARRSMFGPKPEEQNKTVGRQEQERRRVVPPMTATIGSRRAVSEMYACRALPAMLMAAAVVRRNQKNCRDRRDSSPAAATSEIVACKMVPSTMTGAIQDSSRCGQISVAMSHNAEKLKMKLPSASNAVTAMAVTTAICCTVERLVSVFTVTGP